MQSHGRAPRETFLEKTLRLCCNPFASLRCESEGRKKRLRAGIALFTPCLHSSIAVIYRNESRGCVSRAPLLLERKGMPRARGVGFCRRGDAFYAVFQMLDISWGSWSCNLFAGEGKIVVRALVTICRTFGWKSRK